MRLLRRLRYLLRHDREAQELAEEMEFHRDLARQSGAHMGNATLAAEDARRIWIGGWIESVFQDLGYAIRSLTSQPAFTGMALLALVLGIGLNTSLFTAVNAVLFRGMEVPEPESMVELLTVPASKNLAGGGGFPV